jgi:hypothetical protein
MAWDTAIMPPDPTHAHPRPHAGIPAPLVEHAPLTLRCPICRAAVCARPDRTALWHQVPGPDRVALDCPGTGMPGLPTGDLR